MQIPHPVPAPQPGPNNNNNHGGQGNAPAPRTSQDVAQELAGLKRALDAEVNKLPGSNAPQGQAHALNTRQAIAARIEKAIQDQAEFTQGKLLKQMKDQHEALQKELVAEANIRNKNDQIQFNNALGAYLKKRLELAKLKLEEITSESKYTKKAQKEVLQQYRTSEGKTGAEVLQKFGSGNGGHNKIIPINGKEKEIVEIDGGKISSKSPRHAALTAKALRRQSHKFTHAKGTYGGAKHLINSAEEMLRAGMKQVEFDEKILAKMRRERPHQGHSCGDYAIQLERFISSLLAANFDFFARLYSTRTDLYVSVFQKRKLEQLNRICKASTAVYLETQSNPVFDANGDLKPGNEESRLGHQAETFMRLSKPDRKAYLKILFPKNTERYYAAFTKELERRGKKFAVGSKVLSPKEYFEQELLWRVSLTGVSRSQYQAKVNLVNDVETFKDPATSDADRKAIYNRTTDEKSLRQMVKSDPLNTNQKRTDFANAVFDKANEVKPDGNHHVGLYTHPVTVLRYVTTEERKQFIKQTLPLFAKTSVTDPANNNQVDFAATLRAKSTLLADLRDKAEQTYVNEKAAAPADSPTPFNNYYKNKILLDELESEMLQDHTMQVLNDQARRAQAQPTQAEQQAAFQDTQMKHLQTFINTADATQKADYFVKRMSPKLQEFVWATLNDGQPQPREVMARILKQLMDLHNEAQSPAAMDYLKERAKSLLARCDDAQKTALINRVGELCTNSPNNKNIVGVDRRQNRALHVLRDLVPTPAGKPLQTTELFRQHYQSSLDNASKAEKLVERIKCYASENSANFVANFRLAQKFKAEMGELLYPSNALNAESDAIIAAVKQTLQGIAAPANLVKNLKLYVDSLEALGPNANPVAAQQQGDNDSDVELDSSVVDTADNSSVSEDESDSRLIF